MESMLFIIKIRIHPLRDNVGGFQARGLCRIDYISSFVIHALIRPMSRFAGIGLHWLVPRREAPGTSYGSSARFPRERKKSGTARAATDFHKL